MLLKKEYVLKCLWINVFTFSAKNGILENTLRILDLCQTPETDSMNLWGSIELRLRTTDLATGSFKTHSQLETVVRYFIFKVL